MSPCAMVVLVPMPMGRLWEFIWRLRWIGNHVDLQPLAYGTVLAKKLNKPLHDKQFPWYGILPKQIFLVILLEVGRDNLSGSQNVFGYFLQQIKKAHFKRMLKMILPLRI